MNKMTWTEIIPTASTERAPPRHGGVPQWLWLGMTSVHGFIYTSPASDDATAFDGSFCIALPR